METDTEKKALHLQVVSSQMHKIFGYKINMEIRVGLIDNAIV